ncbi:MAG: MbcA/ParS/Xre antitoxin family protein [Myxococcota bacterium]
MSSSIWTRCGGSSRRPAERVKSIEGLVRVVEYLDAMRGKL